MRLVLFATPTHLWTSPMFYHIRNFVPDLSELHCDTPRSSPCLPHRSICTFFFGPTHDKAFSASKVHLSSRLSHEQHAPKSTLAFRFSSHSQDTHLKDHFHFRVQDSTCATSPAKFPNLWLSRTSDLSPCRGHAQFPSQTSPRRVPWTRMVSFQPHWPLAASTSDSRKHHCLNVYIPRLFQEPLRSRAPSSFFSSFFVEAFAFF